MQRDLSFSRDHAVEEQKRFMLKVYNWMGSGLFLTAFVAYSVVNSPFLMNLIYGNQIVFFGLIVAEIGLVVFLAARIQKMSAQTAKLAFMGYSAINGATLASIFMVYTSSNITSAFVVTAGTFGAMSLYGYTTKKDLTSMGGFLFMGLIGGIIATVVNLFLQSPMISWVITYVLLFVFIGLTAYDTQKIKTMCVIGNEGTDDDTKQAVSGALMLYLDFINLFILFLQIMGGDRD